MKNNDSYYICDAVHRVRLLHQSIINRWYHYESTFTLLNEYAINLYRFYAMGYPYSVIELQNWQLECIGKSKDEIFNLALSQDDIQEAVALQFGYKDWNEVIYQDQSLSLSFERAIDMILNGNIEDLNSLIDADPDVLNRHSSFGHRASLLHYLAANGVETHRQITPYNGTAIMQLLLDRGADPHKRHNIYQGNASLQDLISSSAHPYEAGIANSLLELLQ